MAISNSKQIERIPWDGENHKEQGYNEPTVTNSMMAITPELLKGNIVTTGKDKQGKPMAGVEQKQVIISNELEEGMVIPAKSNARVGKEQGE